MEGENQKRNKFEVDKEVTRNMTFPDGELDKRRERGEEGEEVWQLS